MRIVVVAAAIVQNAQVLAARRLRPAGQWEFPGGKVESDESAAEAIVRECHEELGVRVRAVAALASARDARIELHLWEVRLLAGTPAPLQDHDELRWLGVDELDGLDWLPVDRELLGAVRRLLG